eukprot:Skav214477  [mRNA]  locus=scaffold1167:296948:298327:+ [translate_table: standard]
MWDRADKGLLDLSRCVPLLLHGDEGRGRKKCPFLILSWSSVLGFGTESANRCRKQRLFNQQRLNYIGSTHLTRFITSALPKIAMDGQALSYILEEITRDANDVFENGVRNALGETFFASCVNAVGDWQWLVKAGNLSRSYTCVNKRPMAKTSVPRGICHLCLAGQRGVVWENYRVYSEDVKPDWLNTMFQVDPWNVPSPLNGLPYIPGEEAGFYTFDLFHSYHLGVGKTLGASCLALASQVMVSSNVDDRLEELTALFKTWAAENKVSLFISGFTKANLGWPDTGSFPNGQWSKGHVTSTVVDFFIDWAKKRSDLTNHRVLQMCLEACLEITGCLQAMFRSDVWIHQSEAREIAMRGMKFLNLYRALSYKCFQEGLAMFAHMPKGHALDHIFFNLHSTAMSKKYALNPLVFSVQIFEDYIGRCCRISRRTSPQQAVQRVLERCLQASYKHFYDGGFIKD